MQLFASPPPCPNTEVTAMVVVVIAVGMCAVVGYATLYLLWHRMALKRWHFLVAVGLVGIALLAGYVYTRYRVPLDSFCDRDLRYQYDQQNLIRQYDPLPWHW